MRHLLAGSVAVASLVLAASAQAAGECGSTPAGWNAPNGAVVFNRGPGAIRTVLDSLGEYRTHTMLSHGPGAAVTHATMGTPVQADWPGVCNQPIRTGELQYGYPGLQQVNQGGIYLYMYGEDATEWAGWQQGNAAHAALIGDSIWYNHPFVSDVSRYDSGQTIDRPLRAGYRVNYSLFQYRNLQAAHQTPDGYAVNNGIVCSTFMAYAHNYAGRGQVTPYTYSHARIAQGSNSLYTGVYNQCKQSLGWFVGAALTVACPTYNVCGNAGNQVANCMSTNLCDSSDGRYWKSVRDDPSATATSISPDRIGGWGVHPISTTTWGPDYSHQVQWNSGGNVYGCWK